MKTVQKLSEETEKRISNALTKVAELVEAGADPNAALVKAATDAKLTAGLTRLAVRAFNTGRSLEHLRSHDTLEEKAASFRLADASEVLERMFPSNVKTAREEHYATAISKDYDMSPAGWLKRRNQSEVKPMEKAAAAKVAAYPEYPERLQRDVLSQVNDLRRNFDTAKQDAIKSAYAVVQTMDKVAEYFRDNDAIDFVTAAYNARCVLGRRVDTLMQKVATDKTVAHRYRADLKYLGHNWELDQLKMASRPVNWAEEPYSLIKDALDAVDRFDAARLNLNDAEVANSEKRAELLRPFTGERKSPVILGSVWREKKAAPETAAHAGPSFWTYTGATALGNIASDTTKNFAPKSREDLVNQSLDKLSDPAHEDKLRAIRVQAMIHELMAGDPIISGYGYNDVINAYNHLSEVAPKAMQQRVMAQAMLRKYLEQAGSMDIFDTGQMMNVNEQLDKRDLPENLAKGGYKPGIMRSLGDAVPQQNMAVKEPSSPAKLDEMMLGSRSDRGKTPSDLGKQLADIQTQLKTLQRPPRPPRQPGAPA